MNINKFKKISNNKYKVFIDDKVLILYEDIKLKYELLYKKSIDYKLLEKIEKENKEYSIYDIAIKYITVRLRSKKEMIEYLKSKDFTNKSINLAIEKLTSQNIINDDLFCKSFINDKINLTNWGINKIKGELEKLGIDEVTISKNMNISNDVLIKRIETIINKELKINIKVPTYKLKNKIVTKCISLGYNYENILEVLNDIDIKSESDIKKEYEKLYKKYSNKYDGNKLNIFIKNKLYQRGYSIEDINNIFE